MKQGTGKVPPSQVILLLPENGLFFKKGNSGNVIVCWNYTLSPYCYTYYVLARTKDLVISPIELKFSDQLELSPMM